jgi:hypothetical protein
VEVRWVPAEAAMTGSNQFERAMISAALHLPAGRGTG